MSRFPASWCTAFALFAFVALFPVPAPSAAYDGDVAAQEVIDEAIRLARKFATKEAGGYVHALLEAIHNAS